MNIPSQRNNPGLQDDHDPSDIAQRQNNRKEKASDHGGEQPAVASESNAFKVPRTPGPL